MRARASSSVPGWRAALFLGIAILLATAPVPAARGEGTVTTNSTTALLHALGGGGEVRLSFLGTLTLELPLLIAADTVLVGDAPGGRTVSISGAERHRLFRVLPGIRFEVRNLILRDGLATNGAAILNEGLLHVSNVVFQGCSARGTAGAAGAAGAERFGYGEDGESGQPGEPASGGAILNLGEATLLDCTFDGNEAVGGDGGLGGAGGQGGWRTGAGGDGGSGATAYGGAVANAGFLRVTNCVFAGNSAQGGDGASGGGGGGDRRGGARRNRSRGGRRGHSQHGAALPGAQRLRHQRGPRGEFRGGRFPAVQRRLRRSGRRDGDGRRAGFVGDGTGGQRDVLHESRGRRRRGSRGDRDVHDRPGWRRRQRARGCDPCPGATRPQPRHLRLELGHQRHARDVRDEFLFRSQPRPARRQRRGRRFRSPGFRGQFDLRVRLAPDRRRPGGRCRSQRVRR
jgi:hypothetical protein